MTINGLNIKQVQAKVCAGKTFVYNAIGRNEFPRPIRIGDRSIWIEKEIDDWLAARIAERDNAIATGAPSPTVAKARIAVAARIAAKAASAAAVAGAGGARHD